MGAILQRYRKLFESVKKGPVLSLYFLYGPEEYLKKEFIRELLDGALSGSNRAFNLDILYGDEFDRRAFDDRVGSFPLFTEKRVVILRNFERLSTAEKDHVVEVAETSHESVVLVVETPKEALDTARLRALKKVVDARGLSFKFETLEKPETMERVRARFEREGYSIKREVLELLVESVGTKLMDLTNEVEKICIAVGEEKEIGPEVVSSIVGEYRTENLFSLFDALGERSPSNMLLKLNRLIDGGEEPVVMLGMLLKRVVLLLEVKTLSEEHGRKTSNDGTLAGLMYGNISPYYAGKLRSTSSRFERSELDTLLANLRWADYKLKTSNIQAKHVVEEAFLASHIGKTLANTNEYL